MSAFKKMAIGFFVLIMILAMWSRIAQLKEGPQIIRNSTDALARLYKGVLK